jgi:hypothetical protein
MYHAQRSRSLIPSLRQASLSGLVLLAAACFPKPPQITYLSPVDRIQEGFLDPVTYQIVSYGRALDLSKPFDLKTTLVPTSIGEAFDHEAFTEFNQQQLNLLKQRKPTTGFPLGDILVAEANQLNPQEINLALIDEKIRGPMEIKRVLFDNACLNARVLGLYRWLISDVMQMKLLHGATLPREGLALTSLDARYFPPRDYYVAESPEIAKNIDAAMQKKKFRYEIVQEIFTKPDKLECKVAIHIHKRNLQVNMPFLAPL